MSEISAEEIKATRLKYGLTQKSFATLLGIGSASITRYESGTKPTKANENLIRAAQDARFMQGCLRRDGASIPPAQRAKAQECVYAFINLDVEGDMPMDEMTRIYKFTLQQEVLNEQAANIVCDILRFMQEKGISLQDEANPLVVLVNELFEVKQIIVSRESRNDQALEQIRGFLKYTERYVSNVMSMKEAA